MSGLLRVFLIDGPCPTPPLLQECVDEINQHLEAVSRTTAWSSHQEAQLRSKLAAADFPQNPNHPASRTGLKFRNMSLGAVVITQVGGTKTGTLQANKDWGFANVAVGSRWRIEAFESPGIKAPEYMVTTTGSHTLFIVDLKRPLAVTKYMDVSKQLASSLPLRPWPHIC
jgi:hypothetical protein